MFKFFKRKFKNEWRRAINKKIAFPEDVVLCPRCKTPLNYFQMGSAAEVQCPSKKCIKGDSRGNYQLK